MQIALVWAMAENRVIGKDGRLPWRLPAEMAHFRRVTMGHPVIMGRRTFTSMKQPLAGRTNIVLSRSGLHDVPEGVHVVADFGAALAVARMHADAFAELRTTGSLENQLPGNTSQENAQVMIVGGADVYALALPRADVLHMTLVHASPEGDTWFPEFDRNEFVEESTQRFAADERNGFDFTIYRLRRK